MGTPGRPRIATTSHIDKRLRQGWDPADIAAEARKRGEVCPSLRTLQRRRRELVGDRSPRAGKGVDNGAPAAVKARVSRATKPAAAPVPADPKPPTPAPAPTEVPAAPTSDAGVLDDLGALDLGTDDAAVLTAWMARAERFAAKAEADENAAAFLSAARLTIDALKRRAALRPPPPPDPNANPDMVAAAQRARVKLHELLDRALEAVA